MCETGGVTSTPNKSLSDMEDCFSNILPIEGLSYPVPVHVTPVVKENVDFDPLMNQRIEKSHWICDYSDDIFNTLRESEQRRCRLAFHSPQVVTHRPTLLDFMKMIAEQQKLSRTTLHLAVYLLDYFMDNYLIRSDKLSLTVITCLLVASKIEETDMNIPKFSFLNKLVGEAYTLVEFKKVESKVLTLFGFNLLRPTVATFIEYFANNFITLEDYHVYVRNWRETGGFQQLTINLCPGQCQNVFPLYTNYEGMLMNLGQVLFELADLSLNYVKFANERQSIIAAACIAVVRQLHHVAPIWTPYLITFTQCTDMMLTPFTDTLIALYGMHVNKVIIQTDISNSTQNCSIQSELCDSPDSGIISAGDTSAKSESEDEVAVPESKSLGTTVVEDDPILVKRRRIA